MEKKSKGIFFILAVLAIVLLVLLSVTLAEEMWGFAILLAIGFVAIFGIGFTLKKKYRENDWL
ncbi:MULTISPECIES: DUF5325 family protein [Nosocomiicoccus]|uniref:DUF5325 family protein n=1 Tax=Nosocomiicoccus massiliensis TaxID=1232430 RepID=A0AAF1BRM3_9STAP|nr:MULTISPECIES: DUF5325 family protein [Nosocomiicoccus]MDK6863396.1 DUF5325 family protein [Nosocomiicoccus ampullae]OFO51185.1 hypothetical protein HMPREF3029_07455 [Nosocomiicoccus sp. HMSC059G07]OFS62500.1 hypothetical protein HMPREF3177_05505 [Nosocomiicoccus sp. HMSC09A07]WOS96173.1 DUF5325 family protein [Nosocomiicoccus massiliensis]